MIIYTEILLSYYIFVPNNNLQIFYIIYADSIDYNIIDIIRIWERDSLEYNVIWYKHKMYNNIL